ncbi:MAG: oxidoreductase [Gracilibacter sp. BRH_c7a]|nr:MAG: oxidoreductase [Gracilibacter sp. BRH_c7a]
MEWHAPWDIRIALDLFLGGLGVGVFIISVLLNVSDKERNSKISLMGSYLAPLLVGGGVLFLLSELGRPERFLSTLYNFNPQSVTSWGGLFQIGFMIIALVYAWQNFKGKTNDSTFRTLQGLGLLFAILIGVYHGLLLASLGRPLWGGGMIIALFLGSSLFGGIALLVILKELGISIGVPAQVRSETAATSSNKGFNFTVLFFIISAVELVLVLGWQFALYRSGTDTLAAVNSMMESFGGLWVGLVIIAGLLIPLLGSLFAIIKDKNSEMSKGLAIILSALVIVGSYTFKHIVIIAGQGTLPLIF